MNRFLARLFAGCLWAAALQIAAAAPSAPAEASDELLRAATEILQKADANRVSELWDSGSGVLKNRMSKGTFIEITRKARQSMGPVAQRDWSSTTRLKYQADNESGLPAGLYANVVFSTHLASGKEASEKISFVKENRNWIFTGYAIAREAPETSAAPAAPATPAAPAIRPTPSSAPPAALPSTPDAGAGVAEVEAAVRTWASAWSAQDMDGYLAAYAPGFTPARGQSRRKWEEERRMRITGKSSIGVTIEDLKISIDGQTASARFQQNYRADKLRETSRKTLALQRSGSQWLILRESTGG